MIWYVWYVSSFWSTYICCTLFSILSIYFCFWAGRACLDNAETQPLHDISTAPVPSPESEAVTASPDMSSSQRRAHYQNLKGMGEETVEFGASGTTSSAMTGKAESEKKVNTSKPGMEKENFTDAEDEVMSDLGRLTGMSLTKKWQLNMVWMWRIVFVWLNLLFCWGHTFSLPSCCVHFVSAGWWRLCWTTGSTQSPGC